MSNFVIKQPNGLYCLYSRNSCCPLKWNLTAEEYIEYELKDALEETYKEAVETLNEFTFPIERAVDCYAPGDMSVKNFLNFLKDTLTSNEKSLIDNKVNSFDEEYFKKLEKMTYEELKEINYDLKYEDEKECDIND